MDGEPAGKIITSGPGSVEVWASLVWRSREEVPRHGLLPPIPAKAGSLLVESLGGEPPSRLVTGELRAYSDRCLAETLDLVLRTLVSKAALTEAQLETRVVRLTGPHAPQAQLVQTMARELWGAGIRVTFGPSSEPVSDADLSVGAGGAGDVLENVICESGTWELASRRP
ncbi:MAG: hypothetical protein ACFB50_09285 [Rubrobacteraceae bacterium]